MVKEEKISIKKFMKLTEGNEDCSRTFVSCSKCPFYVECFNSNEHNTHEATKFFRHKYGEKFKVIDYVLNGEENERV